MTLRASATYQYTVSVTDDKSSHHPYSVLSSRIHGVAVWLPLILRIRAVPDSILSPEVSRSSSFPGAYAGISILKNYDRFIPRSFHFHNHPPIRRRINLLYSVNEEVLNCYENIFDGRKGCTYAATKNVDANRIVYKKYETAST